MERWVGVIGRREERKLIIRVVNAESERMDKSGRTVVTGECLYFQVRRVLVTTLGVGSSTQKSSSLPRYSVSGDPLPLGLFTHNDFTHCRKVMSHRWRKPQKR